ncbi:hypothetical protein [Phyllobacterium sp. SB3]|uniref:hypothetical protein n=1 Tax=Phyllobacterium sp. SB3 TaxID=3156073 RepID=UPI0032AEEA87
MAIDWISTLQDQAKFVKQIAAEVSQTLDLPKLSPAQASLLYHVVEQGAQTFDRVMEEMENQDDVDNDLTDGGRNHRRCVDEPFCCCCEQASNHARLDTNREDDETGVRSCTFQCALHRKRIITETVEKDWSQNSSQKRYSYSARHYLNLGIGRFVQTGCLSINVSLKMPIMAVLGSNVTGSQKSVSQL